jgi:hypothetical protein
MPRRRGGTKAQTGCLVALLPFVLLALVLSWCGRVLGCGSDDDARATKEPAPKVAPATETPKRTESSATATTAPTAAKVAAGREAVGNRAAGRAPAAAKPTPVSKPHVQQPQEPARVRMLMCRDGTPSPSCVCGGPEGDAARTMVGLPAVSREVFTMMSLKIAAGLPNAGHGVLSAPGRGTS